ncbi:hypothetical protein N7537_006350 [Penicillium hordei]|uniref:Uncharacterized protein n=1 Tax=Penicillium hordei TaxID=40994 RepID=A0AAD6E8N3_9EURO|nr:uncharacterized protein N7537_006350 [Penicillium hordei]KAJ5603394.1 hypothetical protein N7537_006350 [Penicillium hordei]
MPYQEVNSAGKRVLCRTGKFANSHAGFDSFPREQRATSLLQQLAEGEMLLFKEKINYRLAGSVDGMNAANGGLEVVNGSHCMDIPLGSDRCIASDWAESNVWTPAELESGMQIAKSPTHSSLFH